MNAFFQHELELGVTALAPAPALELEAPKPSPLDGLELVYCTTAAAVKPLLEEMRQAAQAWPIGIDLESIPLPAEAARLEALLLRQASLKGELRAARHAKAPRHEIEALEAERKLLKVRVKYAGSAALDPHRSRIRLVQLYGGGPRVVVIDIFRTGEGVLRLLDGLEAVAAHNAAFELSFLEAAGVELGETHCTLQAARLTLGGYFPSLAVAAKEHLGVELDKAEQLSDWSAPELSRAQLEYAALDAVIAFRLAQRVLPALGPQTPAYEIQIGVTPAAMRLRQRGVWLDLKAHAELMESYATQRREAVAAYRAACADMGRPELAERPPEKAAETRALLEAILTSDELRQWQRTPKAGVLSTARSELRRAAHYPPVVALVKLSRLDKMLSAFGPALAELVSPVTGRIHAGYSVGAAASGRATCSYPNIQQAPRDKAFRALFKAAPGFVFVGGDYSSMELRAVAHIAGDRRMTRAFEAGADLHRLTASRVTGKPPEEISDEERRAAKPVNFGAVYGMGARGLVKAAWRDYEMVIEASEARAWLDAFAQAYPDTAAWRRRHADQCEREGRIVIGRDAAAGIGRIFPLSRLPAGWSAYTRACNLPVQGSCADASMRALWAIDALLFQHGIEGSPVLWLHDEIVLEVPQADAELAAALLKRAMVAGFAKTFPHAPTNGLVEVRIGADWAAVKG